jgi:hypothetical protein
MMIDKQVDGWHSLDLFNAFCGGVFIAVGLIHLLPASVSRNHFLSVHHSATVAVRCLHHLYHLSHHLKISKC